MATAEVWLAHLRTAAGAAAWALGRILAACYYLVVVPLRYPLYYVYRLAVFLLSPVRSAAAGIVAATGFVVGLAARLQLACAALIGVVAGCVLHGTSNLIFGLLGVDAARQAEKEALERQAKAEDDDGANGAAGAGGGGTESELWLGEYGSSSATTTTTTSSEALSGGSSARYGPKGKSSKRELAAALDHHRQRELFEDQWKLIRAPSDKPRRRRRGLLAQTIHEESSESDSL